jgi:hypothetical protein
VGATVVALLWGVFSSWAYNDRFGPEDWRRPLRADASGYYIYIPGAFQYCFRASLVDPELPARVGQGFRLDQDRDRIITKYYYGAAVLMAPFHLIAELVVGPGTTDGFSAVHQRWLEAGGMFYGTMGLLLLALACQRLLPAAPWVAPVMVLAVAFGTNVFYYAFRMPGYSHIYSFFWVCLAIWCVAGMLKAAPPDRWRRWIFHLACAMIFWTRPVDAIAIAGLYAWLLLERCPALRKWTFWAGAGLVLALVSFPQMAYWKFVHGTWLYYSYGDEGFKNWAEPDIIRELFAPENGLVSHAPAMLLLPLGLWALWRSRRSWAILVATVFAVAVYACAAWDPWHFGCSYGLRPMVQYMPFLGLAIWSFLERRATRAFLWRCVVLPVLLALCFVNYRVMLQFSSCDLWVGWDWSWYIQDIANGLSGAEGPRQ